MITCFFIFSFTTYDDEISVFINNTGMATSWTWFLTLNFYSLDSNGRRWLSILEMKMIKCKSLYLTTVFIIIAFLSSININTSIYHLHNSTYFFLYFANYFCLLVPDTGFKVKNLYLIQNFIILSRTSVYHQIFIVYRSWSMALSRFYLGKLGYWSPITACLVKGKL